MPKKKMQPKPSNVAQYKTGILQGLNFKQRRFAEYYVIYGNKTKAALEAGYSANSASWQGSRLYRNDKVRAYIQFLIGEQDTEIMASIDEAKRRMTMGLRGELTEQVVVMVKTEKITYRNGKRIVTKLEEPKLIDKRISMRDQIEASKLLINIMDKSNDNVTSGTKTTEDKLLEAMKERVTTASKLQRVDNSIQFEEDEEEQPQEIIEGSDDD
jgi:phage terminase small subunit